MLLGLLPAVAAEPAAAAEETINHGGLVGEIPRLDLAEFQDGEVLAGDQVGRYLVLGGDFTTIRKTDGTLVTQPYLAAIDIGTGELVENFAPQLNGDVLAVFPGPDDESVYVGGRFTQVNGNWQVRMVRLNLHDGSVYGGWQNVDATAKVTTIDESGGRLFVGGDFARIGGRSIEHLAELNPETGAVNPSFSFNFTGSTPMIHAAEIVQGGTRLAVVHKANSINGAAARTTAVFNISSPGNPSLTPHRMSNRQGVDAAKITGGDISPDGRWMAVSQGFRTASDYVYLVAVSDTANETGGWTHYMRDSSTGITVSDAAVYVGGHFCKLDAGPRATDPGVFRGQTCTGSFFNGGVWRKQIAALSLTDGTPLDWDPGNDAFRGAELVHAIPRGLIIGYDGTRTGTGSHRVGPLAFFDLGAPALPPPPDPPDPPVQLACAATVNDGTVTLTWDDAGVGTYVVRRDNGWLANVNTLTYNDTPTAGDHSYVIRVWVGGGMQDISCQPNPITVTGDPPPA
ncbi:MAG: hypothetical protein GY698_16285, partial [Actinomycetia bacterium]|nr:hypothetical protein [Actinomycetes bacterium]